MMNVSFIIPVYNAERTLAECITSILELEREDLILEIIVVDNNSTDGSVRIASLFPSVKILREERQGRSFARNSGIKYSIGEYVAFVDSDVVLDKGWLINLMKLFQYPTIGGAQGKIIPINSNIVPSLDKYRMKAIAESTKNEFILLKTSCAETPMINSAACLYRKSAVSLVGGFDHRLERHEDIDLSKRVCLSGHDLAASSLAVARVYYHGVGWGSYLMRSYEEGKTKTEYLQKWKKYIPSKKLDQVKVSTVEQLPVRKLFFMEISEQNIINIKVLIKTFILYPVIGLFCFQPFYLQKSLVNLFGIFGRFSGLFNKKSWNEWKIDLSDSIKLRNYKMGDISTSLEEYRFIFVDESPYFVIECSSMQVTPVANLAFLTHILKPFMSEKKYD